MPGSENWHAAVVCLSPSNRSSPSLTPPLPRLPLRSLIQQICSECMAALLTKRILRWGAEDVGLRWTRHSAAHWPAGPFSAHTEERRTKTLKAGAAPQRKHLLVIVFDCIIKMMFFFNLGLLRPRYFPPVTWSLCSGNPSLAPRGTQRGKYWKWSKDLPTLYFNPSCLSSVLWQKHKYVGSLHYRMEECAGVTPPPLPR